MTQPGDHAEQTGFFETKITRSLISKFQEFVCCLLEFVAHFFLSMGDGRYSFNHLVQNVVLLE